MDKLAIRPARPADIADIERIVHDAYAPYITRMGQRPGPMDDDYPARVTEQAAWVLERDGGVAGLVVLLDEADHLLLDNVAVARSHHGQGLGRVLVAFAEAEARRRGYREIRLYTHVTMTENLAIYARLGFEETHRGEQAGFHRVFMRKRLGA
ncbi:MAG: GNAT family N-acetyltransferase [Pseudomonadota bacterium]